MPENMPEHEETQETQETEGTNNVPTEGELAVIKAELEQERASLAEAQGLLTEKDERITTLETELGTLKSERELTLADLAAAREANQTAVTRYLEAVKAVNPAIPAEIIAGDTVAEIDASVQKAQAIAERVKANLEAEAQNTRVPAGAPTRAVNIDALQPREKILLGLQQEQGGTS